MDCGLMFSGMIFFGEYKDLSLLQVIMFTFGVLVTVFGVVHLTGRTVSAVEGITVFFTSQSLPLMLHSSAYSAVADEEHCEHLWIKRKREEGKKRKQVRNVFSIVVSKLLAFC